MSSGQRYSPKLPRSVSPYIIRPTDKKSSDSRRRNHRSADDSGKPSGRRRQKNVTSPREADDRKGNNNDVNKKSVSRDDENRRRTVSDTSSSRSGSGSGSGSGRSSYTDDTWSRDSRGEGRQERWARKEVRSLSKTVENKLTYLVNAGQRENNFSPLGVHLSTYKMMPYDVQYKILELEIDKAERRKNKLNAQRSCKSRLINPMLYKESEPLMLHTQVARITEFANKVFESVPVPNLALIHRYRPHSPNVTKSPEHGDVQNYNCHLGAALHTKHYVDFYLKEGLQTGNRSKSPRLQRLSQNKKNEEKKISEKGGHKTKSKTSPRQRAKSGEQKRKQNKASDRLHRESSFTTGSNVDSSVTSATDVDQSSSSEADDNSRHDYSSDFDAEESSSKDVDADSVSVHTYVSSEHASRTDVTD